SERAPCAPGSTPPTTSPQSSRRFPSGRASRSRLGQAFRNRNPKCANTHRRRAAFRRPCKYYRTYSRRSGGGLDFRSPRSRPVLSLPDACLREPLRGGENWSVFRFFLLPAAAVRASPRGISLQTVDVERRILPAVDRLLISLRRRRPFSLQQAAAEPDFQDQIVDRFETVRDGEAKFVDIAFRHCDGPDFGLPGRVLPCRPLEMTFNLERRIEMEEAVDQVVAGVANGVVKDPGLRAVLPYAAIVLPFELLFEEVDEERDERHVPHARDHQFADLLLPSGRHPDQRRELSFERVPCEIDESDACEVLVVEPGPLPSRQWRVFEQSALHPPGPQTLRRPKRKTSLSPSPAQPAPR